MRIEDVDKNFAKAEVKLEKDVVEHSIRDGKFGVFGFFYDEERGCFARLNDSLSKKVSWQVNLLSTNLAGGRIRFSTNSTQIGIKVSYKYVPKMSNMPLTGSAGFVLIEECKKSRKHLESFYPSFDDEKGFTSIYKATKKQLGKPGQMHDYIIYTSMYCDYISEISILLDSDAVIEKGKEYKSTKPILYYGSSITQGGCVSRGDCAYQAFIEKWTNVDFINLGFSGSAKAESEIIDYIASYDCSVIVFDYDYNAPNAEHLMNTHYASYKKFRESKPNTPIIFASRPSFYDWSPEQHLKRLNIVKKTYQTAKANGDKNVYFIDGRKFFGRKDNDCCTSDRVHPNDLGHYKMAKQFYKIIKNLI